MAFSRKVPAKENAPCYEPTRGCFGMHCFKLGAAFASLYLLVAILAALAPKAYVYLMGVMSHGMLYVNTATANAADYAAAASRIDVSIPTLLVGAIAWLLAGYLLSCLLCYSSKCYMKK